MKVTNTTFRGEEVLLDGNEFEGCVFESCVIVYGGGAEVTLANNTFDQCDWRFVDAAERTLRMLHALYHGGGKELIEATFENIRRGTLESPPDSTVH